jgi:hypothetical protein
MAAPHFVQVKMLTGASFGSSRGLSISVPLGNGQNFKGISVHKEGQRVLTSNDWNAIDSFVYEALCCWVMKIVWGKRLLLLDSNFPFYYN